MIIRAYLPSDLNNILNLFRETIRTINARDYTPAQIKAWASDNIDYDRWNSRLSSSCTFVVEGNNELLGFANLEQDGHVDCVYVHKDHQGKGIASRLLESLEQVAKSSGTSKLSTEASITARPFFEKRGFTLLEEQTVQYNGQEFLNFRMGKVLKS